MPSSTEWAVTVEVAAPDPEGFEDLSDQAVAILEALTAHGAAVSAGGGRLSVTLNVHGTTPSRAAATAQIVVADAARGAGLPRWPAAAIEVLTLDEQDRRLAEPLSNPVGAIEIAQLLGVSRATVDQWRQRDVGFPAQRWTVGGRPAWNEADVTIWASATGRLPPQA